MEALDDVQVEEANDVMKFIKEANEEAARQAEQDEYQDEEPARPKRKKPTPKPRATYVLTFLLVWKATRAHFLTWSYVIRSKRSRSVSQAPSEPAEDDVPAPRRSTCVSQIVDMFDL